MTLTGHTLDDIGHSLTWTDIRDFITWLPQDSAVYRHKFPESWWWTPQLDFLGAVLNAIQWGNWQRGGGKGEKPKPVKRPAAKKQSKNGPKSAKELKERKAVMQTIMERQADGN